MRITVIGCGYLGATHAACMAELGFEVLGVETDETRREQLAKGEAPMFEPGLEDLLRKHVDGGRLRFTDSFAEAGEFGDVHFLCVGTPQRSDSLGADLGAARAAVRSLAPHLKRPTTVVGKSTVPVGTAPQLAATLHALAPAGDAVEVAWNPEFLREGYAVKDTLHPDRLVFGVTSESAEAVLREVFATPIAEGSPVVVTDPATAELVKVSANAFLATKISFINAIAEVCEATGADVTDLADALGHDTRIGRRFLNAGIGFGGGCLPKDIRAFLHRAGELGMDHVMGFLREVDGINQHRREQMVNRVRSLVEDLHGTRIAVLGAAFKPDSDDIRDSPALWIAGQLQLAGAQVSVYDPQAMENSAKVFPTLHYADSVHEACTDAELVLHLTEWAEFRELDPADLADVVAHTVIVDGRNALEPVRWRDAGWTYHSVGRP